MRIGWKVFEVSSEEVHCPARSNKKTSQKCGSVVRGSTVRKIGVYVPKNMTQMSGTADFGGGGDGAAESGGFLETEAVLGSGSSELRRDFDSEGWSLC
ncbi:hypothetical protein QJS10_CPB12g00039 [Acorus calamus]|uniref:Uncharacterized protein n=1 Tax=Acorus calamus TaxID=4465 RepID=A0AAV9DPX2_ACOCL|nr:hypothetical protein QJS10_CPB12g00039 [Acorus calamus]